MEHSKLKFLAGQISSFSSDSISFPPETTIEKHPWCGQPRAVHGNLDSCTGRSQGDGPGPAAAQREQDTCKRGGGGEVRVLRSCQDSKQVKDETLSTQRSCRDPLPPTLTQTSKEKETQLQREGGSATGKQVRNLHLGTKTKVGGSQTQITGISQEGCAGKGA